MKYKIDVSHYHPDDGDFNKNNCKGWELFESGYPDLAKAGKQGYKDKLFKKHGEFYNTLDIFNSTDLQHSDVRVLFDVLTVKAQYLFRKLEILAEFKMGTNDAEAALIDIKEDLIALSVADYVSNERPAVIQVDNNAAVGLLESLKNSGVVGNGYVLYSVEGKLYEVRKLDSVKDFWAFTEIEVVKPKLPEVRFDGQFLVALPESTKKMLGDKLLKALRC